MNGQAVYIDATTPEGSELQKRLSDGKIIQSLDHLLAKIETLEQAVTQLNTAMAQGPGLISMAADSIDEAFRQSAENGVQIEERLSNALAIADKLTAPAMVEKLNSVLEFADQAPGLASMVTDAVDEAFKRSAENGINIEERLGAALNLANKLTAPEMVQKLEGLLALSEQAPGLISMFVDAIDEEMAKASGLDLATLTKLGTNLTESVAVAERMPQEKVSAFGLFRALRDPDRQKALGFLMNLAKAFGQKL